MGVDIRVGDCREILKTLVAGSVQCCVTSPPYWGAQRDYGDPRQLGMERTPEAFADSLVGIFAEVRRTLADDGTLWLNLGDSYAASGKGGGGSAMKKRGDAWAHRDRMKGWRSAPPGYKNKDLVGIPWLVAFALRRDGWYLRRGVIWEKVTPTEPTRADRPNVQHENVFLLSKQPRYRYLLPERQEGDVWRFASDGSHGSHFATMPAALVARCLERSTLPGDTILDPFGGAGTTGLVADRHRRNALLIELNPEYAELARKRITDDSTLFADVKVSA